MKIKLFKHEITINVRVNFTIDKLYIREKELKKIVKEYMKNNPDSHPVYSKIQVIKYYKNKLEKITGERQGLRECKNAIDELFFKWGIDTNVQCKY